MSGAIILQPTDELTTVVIEPSVEAPAQPEVITPVAETVPTLPEPVMPAAVEVVVPEVVVPAVVETVVIPPEPIAPIVTEANLPELPALVVEPVVVSPAPEQPGNTADSRLIQFLMSSNPQVTLDYIAKALVKADPNLKKVYDAVMKFLYHREIIALGYSAKPYEDLSTQDLKKVVDSAYLRKFVFRIIRDNSDPGTDLSQYGTMTNEAILAFLREKLEPEKLAIKDSDLPKPYPTFEELGGIVVAEPSPAEAMTDEQIYAWLIATGQATADQIRQAFTISGRPGLLTAVTQVYAIFPNNKEQLDALWSQQVAAPAPTPTPTPAPPAEPVVDPSTYSDTQMAMWLVILSNSDEEVKRIYQTLGRPGLLSAVSNFYLGSPDQKAALDALWLRPEITSAA